MFRHTPPGLVRALTRRRSGLHTLASAAAALLPLPAFALGGDFAAVDFAAAAPYTYNHDTGGGAYDDGTIGKTNDVVESLEGGDFACGDIVTYFLAIDVEATPAEARQTAQFQLGFLADTTGQSGAGHVDVVSVKVNRTVQCAVGTSCAEGANGSDAGLADDGGSVAELVEQHFTNGGPFNQAAQLIATLQVDDLEANEHVIVRIDVRTACKPQTSPTGNLQADLLWAQEVWPTSDVINAGNQTIPFKQIGEMAGAGLPLLRVIKTVTSADGTCPGSDLIDATAGSLVKYCYEVRNDGTADLYDVTLSDDNGTPANLADDFSVALTGLQTLGGQAAVGDLASGKTAYGTALIEADLRGGATLTNIAKANGVVGKNSFADSDFASVNVTAPAASLALTVKASFDAICGNADDMDSLLVATGSTVYYCYTITNTGEVAVAGISIADTVNGAPIAVPGSIDLQAGASGTLMSAPIVASADFSDSAIATGTSAGSSVSSNPDSASVQTATSALAISVEASLDPVCGNADDASALTVVAGTSVYWCYTVVNSGQTWVQGVAVLDANYAPIDAQLVAGATELMPGGSATFLVGPETANGSLTETALASAIDVFSFTIDSAQDSAQVTTIKPAVSVTKTASLDGSCPGSDLVTALVGQTVTWCYLITNTGDVALNDVTLTDGDITIQIGSLAAGATYSASATIIAADDVTTAATVSANDAVLGLAVNSQPDAASVDVVHPSLSIATTVSLDGSCPGDEVVNVLSGTAVTWCYLVTNTGDTAVASLGIAGSLNGAISAAQTALAPGEFTYVAVGGVANESAIETAVANATASATGTPVASAPDAAAAQVVHPGLKIDVTVSLDGTCPGSDGASVVAGTQVTWCYAVHNSGDSDLVNVVVTDAQGNVIGTIASLPAGGESVLQSPPTALTQDTTMAVTASGSDVFGFPASGSDAAIVDVLYADLQVTLSAPSQLVLSPTNTSLTYTATVTNLGEATAGASTFTNTLPAGVVVINVTSTSGSCTVSGNVVTCSVGDLAAGEAVSIVIETAVTANFLDLIDSAVVATATPETTLGNNAANVTTHVASPTRTIGFYGTHPAFVQQCLNAFGGTIALGYTTVGTETADNQYDIDKDTRIEQGLNLALGVLNANVAKFVDGTKRPALGSARAQAGRQVLAALCNQKLLGGNLPFTPASALSTLAGSDIQAILALSTVADKYNNAGESVPSFGNPGPAVSSYPWDDPTDFRD